jgi:flagellar hook protein FlgE
MIDSIYIGISGVQSHQTRINVISNNVANINTNGYKAGRANFGDIMSQTLSEGAGASGTTAAINPVQSGLGVKVSSIDTIQTQGSIQTTGIDTDLAIEGEGHFVLSDGSRDYYSRDGTFSFDPNGKLMDPGSGLVVQGNLATEAGSLKSEVEDLVIPLDRESKAEATAQIQLSGNLDVSGNGSGPPVWSTATEFGQPASLAGTPGFPLDLSDLTEARLQVSVEENGVPTESTINVPPRTYADRLELVAELNAQISANGALKDKVLFKADDTGQVILRSIGGGDGVSLSVDNADATVDVATRLGLTPNTQQAGTAVASTDLLNSLANIGQDLNDGDIIRFAGNKPTGERFDGTFTFEAGVSDSLGDLLAVVESVYGGVQAGIDPEDGRLVLTDQVSGDRVVGFDINLSLLDSGVGSGIFGDEPPFEFSTNTQVFDEKGDVHSLTVFFTKSVVANEWNWTATVDGVTPDAGNNGKALFNEDGTLRSFEAADQSALVFQPGDGTPEMRVDLNAGGNERLGGLTQFVAPSSVSVREQDGRAAGNLVSVNIAADGSINGLFSNGDSEILGRVSLASFSNPGGLRREGDNMFSRTEASGQAVVGTAESTVQARIRSGAVELSNVDLSEQFTNLIVSQRGFQASARSITTSDELLSELVSLKR